MPEETKKTKFIFESISQVLEALGGCRLSEENEKTLPVVLGDHERCYFSQSEFVDKLKKLIKNSRDDHSSNIHITKIGDLDSLANAAFTEASAFLSHRDVDVMDLNNEIFTEYFEDIQLPGNILGLSKDTYVTIVIAIIIYFLQHRQSAKKEKKLTKMSEDIEEIKKVLSGQSVQRNY